jgi:hypothetical protein
LARAALLLPARVRFGGQRLSETVARAYARADRHDSEPGERAQLRRHFTLLPDHWPLAALTRRVDAPGDADGACWLRADPAHIRPGINGATLLACGDALAPTREEAEALLRPLRPLFGDAGFPIDAPVPAHWYLRLPREARPPEFSAPAQALGDDVFEHLPDGEPGRRWRALLSEAQVTLHNHPVNARRVEAGKLPVNSLWFWGAGVLPDHVSSPHARLLSDDEVAGALGYGAAAVKALPGAYVQPADACAFDLRHARDLAALDRDWLQPALLDVDEGALQSLQLDFADGRVVDIVRSQRWRFWRKPVRLDG